MIVLTEQILKTEEDKKAAMQIFQSKVFETDPNKCWFFNGKEKGYYPRIVINGRQYTAHRIVFELFYGKVPDDKPFILHSCDKRSCINPNHLRCGTRSDNAIDMRFNNKPMKLSERDVKVVRFMKNLKYTYREISKMFNCSRGMIFDICNGVRANGELPERYTPFQ